MKPLLINLNNFVLFFLGSTFALWQHLLIYWGRFHHHHLPEQFKSLNIIFDLIVSGLGFRCSDVRKWSAVSNLKLSAFIRLPVTCPLIRSWLRLLFPTRNLQISRDEYKCYLSSNSVNSANY